MKQLFKLVAEDSGQDLIESVAVGRSAVAAIKGLSSSFGSTST